MGYFVQPTVLGIREPDRLAQEEIFGPVLVVTPYQNEDEAVAITNSTLYGLGGAVWSGNDERAAKAAFGGYKPSGNGREIKQLGVYGFEEFLEFKSLQFQPVAR